MATHSSSCLKIQGRALSVPIISRRKFREHLRWSQRRPSLLHYHQPSLCSFHTQNPRPLSLIKPEDIVSLQLCPKEDKQPRKWYGTRLASTTQPANHLFVQADKLRNQQELERLQAKHIGTGHPDTTSWEWRTNIMRDTNSSIVGHRPLLSYIALAEKEPISKLRAQLIRVNPPNHTESRGQKLSSMLTYRR
jgi:splicing factor 3B subunit 5